MKKISGNRIEFMNVNSKETDQIMKFIQDKCFIKTVPKSKPKLKKRK